MSHQNNLLKLCIVFAVCVFSMSSFAVESELWKQFKSAKKSGEEPELPDFSYAGYKYSETPIPDTSDWQVFDVTDYGAKPDDDKYDDNGIQKAIDAAEAAGGGIVRFPSGRFKLGPKKDEGDPITIQKSNIVLKGSGSGSTGTEIFMDKMNVRNWLFKIGPSDTSKKTLTTLVRRAKRETYQVEVADASQLEVGQIIVLDMGNPSERVSFGIDYYDPQEIDHKNWTRIIDREKGGFAFHEIHKIAAIEGNKVQFKEPLHITLDPKFGDIRLRSFPTIQNVGIEDILFKGNWNSYSEQFDHHKDAIHDYAWNAVRFDNTVDAWVHNCEFKDWNQVMNIRTSAAITVDRITMTGKKGHAAIITNRSYGILVRDSEDEAGHLHGPGVGYWTAGIVYLRYQLTPGQQIDSHSGSPYATLMDNVGPGHWNGNGGPRESYPHHGKYFVAWNFNVQGGADSYDFWPGAISSRPRAVFAMPYFIGLQGKDINLKRGTYAKNESPGRAVEPSSLFEAQLGLRLLPDYTYCCEEGESKTFSEPADVAYGADGTFAFKNNVIGEVVFDNETFGDPVPGVRKFGFFKKADPMNTSNSSSSSSSSSSNSTSSSSSSSSASSSSSSSSSTSSSSSSGGEEVGGSLSWWPGIFILLMAFRRQQPSYKRLCDTKLQSQQ